MNMRRWSIVSGVVVLAMLVLAVGLTQAQGPGPEGGTQPQGQIDIAEPMTQMSDYVAIQGRLTDGGGSPLATGVYEVTFRFYEQYSGGTALCSDTNNVGVREDGLFSSYIDCDQTLYGQRVFLSIEVEGDGEMTPRQVVRPVPYALSLRPGAVISDTSDTLLTVRSTGSGDADAFKAYAGGSGEAVEAFAEDGVGVFASSEDFVALQAYSKADYIDSVPAVFGCLADHWNTCDAHRDDDSAGVVGYSDSEFGFGGYFASRGMGGVYGEANDPSGVGYGVWAQHNGGGTALYAETSSEERFLPALALVQRNSAGDFVVGFSTVSGSSGDRYWRVDRTGKGFFDGGTQTGGADFAEQMAVEGEEAEYEPGDVLIISGNADRMVELSAKSFDTRVIGIYSSEPGVLAGAPDTDDPLGGIPVAITGIAPCRVSAENGAIQRGDLLVTAATPAHAMRAGDNPPQGTVLGKALGELTEGTGVIDILVSLQ